MGREEREIRREESERNTNMGEVKWKTKKEQVQGKSSNRVEGEREKREGK